MNNLPLQPLVWSDCEPYEIGYIENASTISHSYIVASKDDKFVVIYYLLAGGHSKRATGFATIDEAKAWAWRHYNEKMQPYVKPMPTWIDVDDRLPESECFYLVRLFDGHRDEYVFVILWWNSEHQQFLEWDAMCEPTHWMPIPEFSTMQNLHKGGGCE